MLFFVVVVPVFKDLSNSSYHESKHMVEIFQRGSIYFYEIFKLGGPNIRGVLSCPRTRHEHYVCMCVYMYSHIKYCSPLFFPY